MSQVAPKINGENKKEINSSNFLSNKHLNESQSHKSKKFTLSTVIYKRFGKGENRKKRYEKITNEIKKIENNSKKEILKLTNLIANLEKKLNEEKEKEKNNTSEEYKLNFTNKIFNLKNKQLMLMELEKDKKYNYIEVIHKLKKPPESRTVRDVLRIKQYLLQSKLGLNINEEFQDKDLVEKIINFCSIEMNYKQFKKGQIISKIGEKIDSFYSIISGKIDIMKPFKKTVSMTGFEYFKYLMELRKKKEDYIINLCITNNDTNFVIETNHLNIIHYIYLLNYLDFINTNKKPAKELDFILDLIDLKPLELNLDPTKLNSENYTHDYLKVVKKRLPNISHILFEQYSFFNDYQEKKEVNIYEYKKYKILKENDYFGESNTDNRRPIEDTFIADEDCDVAFLSNKLYAEQIASEKLILLEKKIYDLHQNHFFRLIKYGKFEKKYFKLFINEKYKKGDIIANEGDEIKYIYFIQNGTVDLSLTKSINEIEFLKEALLDKKDIILENNKNEIKFSDLTKDNYTFEEYQLENIKNNVQFIPPNDEIDMKYLNQKQNHKLIILHNNEDIGIISLILGKNYITTCTVTSNIADIYKLDKTYLKYILIHEYECKEELLERLKNKIDLLQERLSVISNTKLAMKGIKELNEMENEKKEKEKEDKKLDIFGNSNIKSSVDYEKINTLLELRTELNSSNYKLNQSPESKQTKIENLNLPIIKLFKRKNTETINNIFTDKNSSRGNEDDSNELSKSKIIDLMKKGLMFNLKEVRKKKLINERYKAQSSKKWKIDDKLITRIQKDIKDFSKNKFNITNSKSSELKLNNIMSFTKKSINNIYLTQLNILKQINPLNKTEKEKEFNKSTKSNLITKKFSIPSDLKVNNLNEIIPYSERSCKNKNKVSENYIQFNTESNLINDNMNKSKRYNYSYKNPLALIRKEKYKIFERKETNDKNDLDFMESIEKMKKLKKIYSNMRQNISPKYRK